MIRSLACLALVAFAVPVAGQPPSLPAVKLSIRPAPTPGPRLKYLFLPECVTRVSGNAAYLYQRAHSPAG